jgi:uncharacterized protein YjbI with pentapeptide repeats
LAGVRISGADLSDADLTGANLTGADLSRTKLTDVHLDGKAQLDEACGQNAELPAGLTLNACPKPPTKGP